MFILLSCTLLCDWLIPDICCCDSHRYISYLTLTCIHRYLTCYIWHMIPDTGTCHAIFDMWYPTPVLAMLHLLFNIWYRYLPCCTWRLTCYHLALVYLTWYCDTWPDTITLDTCISLHIHDYHFYGDLAWLLYYYQTFGTPELLYSWTPVFLNPWKRVTPDTILLLIPVIG